MPAARQPETPILLGSGVAHLEERSKATSMAGGGWSGDSAVCTHRFCGAPHPTRRPRATRAPPPDMATSPPPRAPAPPPAAPPIALELRIKAVEGLVAPSGAISVQVRVDWGEWRGVKSATASAARAPMRAAPSLPLL